MSSQLWEVVGGSDKGGIVVREGQSLSSNQFPDRLSTGSVVRELELHGERLLYEKVNGQGPDKGWASLTLKSRPLLVQTNTSKLTGVLSMENLQEVQHAVEAVISKEEGIGKWPQSHCKKLLTWSDLHIDMGENMTHLEGIPGDSEAALILCGDVCTNIDLLRQALEHCKARFKEVFYVPGNHELWVAKTAGEQITSFGKFVQILRLCSLLGVHTGPAFIAPGVAVCPCFSWYKGDFSGTFVPHGGELWLWTALFGHGAWRADDVSPCFDIATYWPEIGAEDAHDPQNPEIANFFLSLNEPRLAEAAALHASGELQTLWTFSHFLPRRELNESGAHNVMPPGVAGDVDLDVLIRTASPTGHVYGHSHTGQDRVYAGVRYVQHPMGYPFDGHREERPLQLWAAHMHNKSYSGILKNVPAAAAQLAADRVRGAIWGALCADALSMPVWCYYSGQRAIKRDYGGPLTGFVKPRETLVGSLMRDEVLPASIEHGRQKYWQAADAKNTMLGFHYHRDLQAGEITLEGHMLRLCMRAVTDAQGLAPKPDRLRTDYIRFMKQGAHNDTWVSLYHRQFFGNLDAGVASEICAERGDPVDTMDALSVQIPMFIASSRRSQEDAESEISQSIRALRVCSPTIAKYVSILSSALRQILSGETLVDVAEAIMAELLPGQGSIATVIEGRKDPMASTSLIECFPTLLHFMFRYASSVKELLLAQANVGGECVYRGSVLGALAGAAHGIRGIPQDWLDGMIQRTEIRKEVEAFVAAVC